MPKCITIKPVRVVTYLNHEFIKHFDHVALQGYVINKNCYISTTG